MKHGCCGPPHKLKQAIEYNDINAVRKLLDRGANPNGKNKHYDTIPLSLAIMYNTPAIAEIIIIYGANINSNVYFSHRDLDDSDSLTLFMLIIQCSIHDPVNNSYEDLISLFISHNVIIFPKDDALRTIRMLTEKDYINSALFTRLINRATKNIQMTILLYLKNKIDPDSGYFKKLLKTDPTKARELADYILILFDRGTRLTWPPKYIEQIIQTRAAIILLTIKPQISKLLHKDVTMYLIHTLHRL
jgi:hypothetical protein